MARIIKTDTPAKERNECMRSCAEVLRLLSQKPAFDDEGKDMCAFLVFNLRRIFRTIDTSAQKWDERSYWKKAERLRHDWRWSRLAADKLESLIVKERWSDIPDVLIDLVPHFSGISVSTITRNPDWWCGAHRALVRAVRN